MDILSILKILSAVTTVSAMVSAALPNKNKQGERVFATINNILNVLAFNFGNAKNEE